MSHRRARVAHELRERLATILAQRVADPRLRDAVLTSVEVAADLGFARVYFRTLGDVEQTRRAFERARPFLRRQLAEGLRLRRVPELDFRLDDTPDQARRIEEILAELEEDSQ
ncbi:MAG: 30S ribosome-binding factor RbfA [Myxococcota bacterium]